MESVTVVVPVFNNASTLDELHERIARSLQRLDYEIVFVDDCSTDASRDALDVLAARDQRVRVIKEPANRGQHRAVLDGLRVARGKHAVILDADLQDPPEEIPSLLEALGGDFDVAFAGRRGRYESVPRLLTSRLVKRMVHYLIGLPLDAGMFMAINGKVRSKLLELQDAAPVVTVAVASTGASMCSIPVERSRRPNGKSSYSAARRAAIGMAVVRAAWRHRKDRS